MKSKTLSEWEVEKGVLVIDGNPKDAMTEAEFNAIDIGKKWGVDHARRIKFLEDNGYKVNRENMINPELSAKPPKNKKQLTVWMATYQRSQS